MLVVRWADEAVEDLATIIDYIDQRNPSAARRLHDDIVVTAENLGERPFLYRPGRVPGTREAVIRPNYLIVYQVGSTFVDVLRVVHAAREYP